MRRFILLLLLLGVAAGFTACSSLPDNAEDVSVWQW